MKKVPKGKVISYKELARAVKSRAYRAVGSAMRKNPFAPKVPCHRVVNSNGTVGNYSAPGGVKKKMGMLRKEGGIIINRKIDLKKFGYTFN